MPWKPSEPGEVPTLGWAAIEWISTFLAAPDVGEDPDSDEEQKLFIPYREQEDFILRFYELNPVTGKRRRRRGVLSRSRGFGKSPLLAALALLEALGEVVPAGWDANGQPVGQPWSRVRTPLVQILAVSEAQTMNTWRPLLEMCQGPVYDEYPGLEPLDTFVNLPLGKIEYITSSPRSTKGNPSDFAVMDQTEEWVKSNGGHNLFEKVKNNTAKRGGSFVESPNAFIPGDDSVAERSAMFWAAIQEGRAKDDSLFYDHREAPPETDLDDRESLVAGLRFAYGDASAHPDGCVLHDPPCPPGHVELDPLISTIWSTDSDVQVSRSDFLNQITHATNSYLSQPVWSACGPKAEGKKPKPLAARDVITLGFDGSRGRAKGKPDATALIGCRVVDGHLFKLGVWEAGDNAKTWPDWQPPIHEIEDLVEEVFRKYRVAAFYADPAKDWRSHVNSWEASYARKLVKARTGKQVKANANHPFEWWMTGGRSGLIEIAVKQFEGAVRNGDVTHDGSPEFTRHVLNARRRMVHTKLTIGKENDWSAKKIDAAIAAILAYQARLDAVAAGITGRRTFAPSRIR